LARQHTKINAFFYGKSYEKGAGHEAHPLVWFDDPLTGATANASSSNTLGVLRFTCNVDFLGIPTNEKEVLRVQSEAFNVGLEFAEKIRKATNGVSVPDFSFVTLRDYYDNSAAGCRFTYSIIAANPVDICADEFDPNGQFKERVGLPIFSIENPNGCAIFRDKKGLPNFTVRK
jgi:hypothetical protein